MISLKELAEQLNYKVFTMVDPEAKISGGYTGDLLSDVMGHGEEETIFITIQAHKNSVAVASLIGMRAILLCNGRTPADDMVSSAEQEKIAIFGTDENQFTSSAKIATLLASK
jgi:hypothetical protein